MPVTCREEGSLPAPHELRSRIRFGRHARPLEGRWFNASKGPRQFRLRQVNVVVWYYSRTEACALTLNLNAPLYASNLRIGGRLLRAIRFRRIGQIGFPAAAEGFV